MHWKRLLVTLLVIALCAGISGDKALPDVFTDAFGPADHLVIVHLNVGQGDATLIAGPATPRGNGIARMILLFDAGDIQAQFDGGHVVWAALNHYGVKQIDLAFLSHVDADHVGGFSWSRRSTDHQGTSFAFGPDNAPGVEGSDEDGDGAADFDTSSDAPDLDEWGEGDDITVGTFIDNGERYTSIAFTHYNQLIQGRHFPIPRPVPGMYFDLGRGATAQVVVSNGYVLGATEPVPDVDTANEKSLGILVRYGGFDYLLCGDLIGRAAGAENAEVEKALGEYLSQQGINIDVLHVNHHGANNTSETTFLDRIRPEWAVISVGNKGFGHPTAGNLERLHAAGVGWILQTTRGDGPAVAAEIEAKRLVFDDDIVVRTDGLFYEVDGRPDLMNPVDN